MDGTTLCPHCQTRFRIIEAQLQAYQGMVRCGHCLQTFDARSDFIPDQPSPQIELPILDKLAVQSHRETLLPDEILDYLAVNPDATTPAEAALPNIIETTPLLAKTLAEQVIMRDDADEDFAPAPRRTWPWFIAALLLLLVIVAQAAYWFRVDIATQLPGLKPVLIQYCQLLNCTVPLPQNNDLLSIESSDLESDPAQLNQITLNALLRSRASYALAFPDLELTLNDTQDQALARRIFKPADYLPKTESETAGLLPLHELNIKLHLDTTDLKPSGYRLVLFYPGQ